MSHFVIYDPTNRRYVRACDTSGILQTVLWCEKSDDAWKPRDVATVCRMAQEIAERDKVKLLVLSRNDK